MHIHVSFLFFYFYKRVPDILLVVIRFIIFYTIFFMKITFNCCCHLPFTGYLLPVAKCQLLIAGDLISFVKCHKRILATGRSCSLRSLVKTLPTVKHSTDSQESTMSYVYYFGNSLHIYFIALGILHFCVNCHYYLHCLHFYSERF
jgi:hypothetical protein